jgi:hypothetical protein
MLAAEAGRSLAQAPPTPISLVQSADGEITIAGKADSEVIDAGVTDDLDLLFVLLSGCDAFAFGLLNDCLHVFSVCRHRVVTCRLTVTADAHRAVQVHCALSTVLHSFHC